ncbi:MAG: hypothetical protein E7560_04975 [Ruminococcaceae bacterium]|nr:hypothetical protein [Oscillospiraceae bacterium]
MDKKLFGNANISPEAIKAAQNGNTDKLLDSLSNDDKQKINEILKDKNALNSILSSPEAMLILKMLGGKNG